jgi:CubicO group peptidase (beta-lactamase class C family)
MFLRRSCEEVLMESMPMTGEANPDLSSIDHCIAEVMRKWRIPGGQCAVAKDGRLVYEHTKGVFLMYKSDAQMRA